MSRLKKQHLEKSGLELARECARIALDTKAEDLVILEVRGLTSFSDYFVIMSGRSTRHVQGLAEAIGEELSAKRISSNNCEGLKEGLWVLIDYNDVIVHIFYKETRDFYDLDGLWHDAPRIAPDAAAAEQKRATGRRSKKQ
ncbi:MAG TPA: ribosome silencing factor [Desulfobulbaceae bacterium]|nr:ribosome silencing factor [Desulfobulbaceae bacterium]